MRLWGHALFTGAVSIVLLVLVAFAPAQSAASQGGAVRTVYIFQPVFMGEGPWVKPKRIPLNNHAWFSELRWRDWGQPVARTTGVLRHNPCIPSCADSTTLRRYRVALTATDIRRCKIRVYRGGGYRTLTLWLYNRVSVRYVSTRPSGYPVTETLPRPCASR